MVASTNTWVDPCANPDRETTLNAIRWVESKNDFYGLDLYPHRDGVSWGEYGFTDMARRQLIDIGKSTTDVTLMHMAGPDAPESVQREYAGMYLDWCLTVAMRGNVKGPGANWLDAALVYHGGEGMKDSVQYSQRIRNAIEKQSQVKKVLK